MEGGRSLRLPPGCSTVGIEGRMRIVNYIILTLSAAAMVGGGLIMVGVLVPRNIVLAEHYRIILGLVILLYGLYRFVVTFNRPTRP